MPFALDAVINLAKRSNKYIDETMPWVLAKSDDGKDRLECVLYNLAEAIRFIGVLISPFMPETAQKITEQINGGEINYNSILEFNENGTVTVGEAKPLFARFDEKKKVEEVSAALFAPAEKKAEENAEKVKKEKEKLANIPSEITIDDFAKVKMKVGIVQECKHVEGADKLLVSKIKIGNEVRQIVSGIAKYYTPEEMVGKKVVVVTNLKPVKLRGVLSEGMILAASDGKNLSVLSPEKPEIGDGTEIS